MANVEKAESRNRTEVECLRHTYSTIELNQHIEYSLRELNPQTRKADDFESSVYTNSTTHAYTRPESNGHSIRRIGF